MKKPWEIIVSENFSQINIGLDKARILFFALLISISGIAQKEVNHQNLVWYGYFNTLKFNGKWSLHNDIQERQFINTTSQHQLVFRSVIHRKLLENWSIAAGITYFLQNPQDPESESNLTVPELRPNIGFENTEKHSFFTISNRYRLEARFFHDVENGELVGGYRFSNYRFRYQLGFDFPLYKKVNKEKINLKIKDEVMLNLGKKVVNNTFDQNRIYLGLNYKLNPNFSIEVGYLNWFQQQKTGIDFYNRDIIRFSVFQTIVFKKNKNE